MSGTLKNLVLSIKDHIVWLYTYPVHTYQGVNYDRICHVEATSVTTVTTNPKWVAMYDNQGNLHYFKNRGQFTTVNEGNRMICPENIEPNHVRGILTGIAIYGITLIAVIGLLMLLWKLYKDNFADRAPCQHCGNNTTYEGGDFSICLGNGNKCCTDCYNQHVELYGEPIDEDETEEFQDA